MPYTHVNAQTYAKNYYNIVTQPVLCSAVLCTFCTMGTCRVCTSSYVRTYVRTIGKVIEQGVHHQVRINVLNGMVVVVQPRLVPPLNVGRVLDAGIVQELAPDAEGA